MSTTTSSNPEKSSLAQKLRRFSLRRRSLRLRLLVAFLALSLIPLLIVIVITSVINIQSLRQQTFNQLESVASLKESEINLWVNTLKADLDQLSTNQNSLELEQGLLTGILENADTAKNNLRNQYAKHMSTGGLFDEIFLLDSTGRVVVSTDEAQEGKIQVNEPYFLEGKKGEFIGTPFYSVSLKRYSLINSSPVLDANQNVIGVIAGRASLNSLSKIMVERAGLGETGETYLVGSNFALLTASRFEGYNPGETYIRTEGATRALTDKNSGYTIYLDYRNQSVVGVYRWIPELKVALLAEQDQSEAFRTTTVILWISSIFTLLAIIVGVVASILITLSVVTPIENLENAAKAISEGQLDTRVQVTTDDEIGSLSTVFNEMAGQLSTTLSTLEQRVADRTQTLEAQSAELAMRSQQLEALNKHSLKRAQQFETIGIVMRSVASIKNLHELLDQVARYISTQFHFYHVGIFLNDTANEYAILSAANSEGGKRMLARGHRLKIGQTGIVGNVTSTGQPRIVLDTGSDAVYFKNPDLPETHSEMALPLKSGDTIIGALDVQSTEINAFSEEDAAVLSILADQITIAIENARQFENTQKSLTEAETIYRQYIQQEWKGLSKKTGLSGFRYAVTGSEMLSAPVSDEIIETTVKTGEIYAKSDENSSALAVPIKLRDQIIGVLNVRTSGGRDWHPNEINLAKAVAERVAISAENARLFEETTGRAERERIVADITNKIRSTNDPQEMLQTAMQELQRALGVKKVSITPYRPTAAPGNAEKSPEKP